MSPPRPPRARVAHPLRNIRPLLLLQLLLLLLASGAPSPAAAQNVDATSTPTPALASDSADGESDGDGEGVGDGTAADNDNDNNNDDDGGTPLSRRVLVGLLACAVLAGVVSGALWYWRRRRQQVFVEAVMTDGRGTRLDDDEL